jgi:hypothetical protein
LNLQRARAGTYLAPEPGNAGRLSRGCIRKTKWLRRAPVQGLSRQSVVGDAAGRAQQHRARLGRHAADGRGNHRILANVTQVSYTNLSTRTLTTSSCVQTSGTLNLVLADLVLTASGAVAAFRYIYLVNTSSTTRTNALIGYYDYGSALTLNNGETLTLDFDNVNGVLSDA